MTSKVVRAINLIAIPVFLTISLISCEGDLDEVGSGILDNDFFETAHHTSEVISYNNDELKVKANKLGQYLLGIYKNNDVGQLEASIVSQMTFGSIDFGTDPSIDSVILNIPYHATKNEEDYEGGASKWKLDSIFGNQDTEYTITISELTTFLNTVDPSEPENELDYYSDQTYSEGALLYSGLFKPNSTDTVLYIKRKEIFIDENNLINDIDTIKTATVSPSIKLPLNTDFFTTTFLGNPSIFESLATFIEYFNGLSIQVARNGTDDTSLMSLNFVDSSMKIYYTNTVNEVKKAQTATFGFTGVTNNSYERDYAGSTAEPFLMNPDMLNGDTRLYLNGASGSIALLDLFTVENLEELRANNWLINEANLVFYIDQNANMSVFPERIFLYNHDDSTQLRDMHIEGPTVFGGFLERDENGDPEKYTFKLTSYISKVLDDSNPIELSQLGLKVFNVSDAPSQALDVIINNYSWTPKGIIVHGNNSEEVDKRAKLEIIYTERK